MDVNTDILYFMDIIQLDEEVVDAKLKWIMAKTKFSNKNLKDALSLLQFKYLINIQEDTDCENDTECDFMVRLIKDVDENIVDNVCKIVKIVLLLNKTKVICNSEHLLQQLLTNISFTKESDALNKTLMINLKICFSILEALSEVGQKITLLFIATPLEKIIDSTDEKLKIYFLTNIVPKLSENTNDYNILDRIWNYIKNFEENKKVDTLKILSCLSDYFLPISESTVLTKFESKITQEYEFWNTILYGLDSNDASLRKISIYLAKRAIESLVVQKTNLKVISQGDTLFTWDSKNALSLKNKWDYYFVLIESLEEQQSNIVFPSLQLFDVLKDFSYKWLACAFNIGLRHNNSQVKLKCVEKRLNLEVVDTNQAQILLEALNDVTIFEFQENGTLKNKILEMCKNRQSFMNIFKVIPNIKWSPIPLFHLSDVLCLLQEDYSFILQENGGLQLLIDITKIACNSVAIRKAVYINISYFIGRCFKCMSWKNYIDIYSMFKYPYHIANDNPLVCLLSELKIVDKEKFYECIINSHKNIDIGLLYLKEHEDDLNIFIKLIDNKIINIQTIITKQYTDKLNVFKDLVYLLKLHAKTRDNDKVLDIINKVVTRDMKTILQYISSLFCNDRQLPIEDISEIFRAIDPISMNDKEMWLQLYKTAVLFMKDEKTDLDKKVLGIFSISTLHETTVLKKYYQHELLTIKSLTDMEVNCYDTNQNDGRLRNAYYEKTCEVIYKHIANDAEDNAADIKVIKDYIDKAIECGGYGCLKWILRIGNIILPGLLKDIKNFNVIHFMNRIWNEIEELKSNNQYNICIKEFIILMTQDVLLQKSEYNNVILSFCNKIIEYGQMKNTPLFYLTEELNKKEIEKYGHVVYIFCDILLYSPVLRRDQRISDSLLQEIYKSPKYGIIPEERVIHFNYEIQNTSIEILSKIKDNETLETIIEVLVKKLDDTFKSKQRYHGNSQTHRTLLMVLQHLLIILLLNWKRQNFMKVYNWCTEFLGKLPHQPSVKICLEWYIALYFYIEKMDLTENILHILNSKNVPLISQFYIIYWLANHKLKQQSLSNEEYEFVLDFLLSHTMGQMFNVRLHAQYMASKLHKISYNNAKSTKYHYIIKVIETTFEESKKEKAFTKLKEDIFTNDFDIIKDLNPAFVYHYLPNYCDLTVDCVDTDYFENKFETITNNITKNILNTESRSEHDNFKQVWLSSHNEFVSYNKILCKNVDSKLEDVNEIGTIQKKYIPWKNMSDVNVYEVSKKKETRSELIVVASLIDKLPNLGGMARTSEVFGVKTYVVDSLRHLQDRQFQGLSVSAERWIDVEEVRPGRPLKEYLAKKKNEGYSVVAAEQTSTSCKLQSFKFPKKTLLLLGHEKEGIPCDLLPLMDHCVEIPQQGFVRSLNVHVTAAIFVWEYSRQNIL